MNSAIAAYALVGIICLSVLVGLLIIVVLIDIHKNTIKRVLRLRL